MRLELEILDWGAILGAGEGAETLGAVADSSEIPTALRRRMPPFARETVRACLRLMRQAPESDLVLSSNYGDIAGAASLLSDLARAELLSPATFSLSVHNAPAGLIGQSLGARSSHTAIAANGASLAAGLLDAYLRLASGDAKTVVVVATDLPAPDIYVQFDEDGPAAHLGLLLTLPNSTNETSAKLLPGRNGVAQLARALQGGARRVTISATEARTA
ncbi:MAG: beta-ketoacyl synthase chain length factor [Caulobacterales bacterium]